MSNSGFEIDLEWAANVPKTTDRGLGATFGELTIRCGSETITRHVHESSVFSSILVPVVPLATWFARCWAELLGDNPPFTMKDDSDAHRALAQLDDEDWAEAEPTIDRWLRGHAIRFAGDGLVLPDLVAWRVDNVVSLSWRAWKPVDDFEFLGKGHIEVSVSEFVRVVRKFIDNVRSRLSKVAETSVARIEFERAVTYVDSPWSGTGLKLVAKRVGRTVEDLKAWLGGAQDGKEIQRRLAEDYGVEQKDLRDPVLIDSPVAMAARSVSTRFTLLDHQRILKLGKDLRARQPNSKIARLRARIKKEESVLFPNARDGYRRASIVRRILKSNRRIDIEKILKEQDCTIVDEAFDDPLTDGIVLWTRENRVLIVANAKSLRTSTSWGRRTMLAHELYHLLFDAGDDRFFGEATGEDAPTTSESAANAFAAELLLPARCLPNDVSRFWTNLVRARKAVGKLCDEFDVGWELVVRQFQNHRKLPDAVVDALLDVPRLSTAE